MLSRFYDYLVEKTQDAYLWLFDWTGVYVGSLMFLIYAASFVFLEKIDWFTYCLFFIWGFISARRHWLQEYDQKLYNHLARVWKLDSSNLVFLFIYIGLVLFVMVSSFFFAFMKKENKIVSDILFFVMQFVSIFLLPAIQVRDRNKKTFFERKTATSEGF